jgi:hypothetical protein
MTDRISELIPNGILSGKNELIPITEGEGGAYVFAAGEKYIINIHICPNLNLLSADSFKKNMIFTNFIRAKILISFPKRFFRLLIKMKH